MIVGVKAPADRHGTLALTIEHLDLDGQPFERIFNIRKDNLDHPMTEVEANELFAKYMEQIERVIGTVDSLDTVGAR